MQATTDANSMLLDRSQNRERSALRLMTWGARFAGAAGLIGAMVLVGYATRTAWTVRLSARLPPMYPNAALGLTLGACAAVGAKRRGPVRIFAAGGAQHSVESRRTPVIDCQFIPGAKAQLALLHEGRRYWCVHRQAGGGLRR